MIRSMLRPAALIITLGFALAGSAAQAAFIGSFGVNANLPVATPTNNLATATSFTFANLSSNGVTSGDFAGLPLQTNFTTTTLNINATSGFNFTNASFGTFTQSGAIQLISQGISGGNVVAEALRIFGTYAGAPGQTGTQTASLTISFTQNGGPGTAISASGSVDVPAVGVPEPASMAMLAMGLVSVGGVALRRRAAK